MIPLYFFTIFRIKTNRIINMLNDVLILQILIVMSVFFLFWCTDVFSTLLLSVMYLLMLSINVFILDADIIVSFLIIIDLGVFLVMFSFMLHVTKFLQLKNYHDLSLSNLNKTISLITLLITYYYLVFFENSSNSVKDVENSWFFYISYYDYYKINNVFINSDLQLLKELYFYINNYEFFVISICIYIGLITAYSIFNFSYKFITNLNVGLITGLKSFNIAEASYFFRYQNIIKQSTTTPSSRVWLKKKW